MRDMTERLAETLRHFARAEGSRGDPRVAEYGLYGAILVAIVGLVSGLG